MKPNEYNPKAREAFGKTLIDIGVGIFKGVFLLLTVVPLTLILNLGFNGVDIADTFTKLRDFVQTPGYFVFIGLLVLAFFVGDKFRREGLRHIHEAEEQEVKS